MIIESYPSPKTVSNSTHLPTVYETGDWARAKELGITITEFEKRCRKVREVWLPCMLFKNDVVYPARAEDYEKYGAMKVENVCGDYRQMMETEWPANDNPFIVSVRSIEKPSELVFCTTGWAVKSNNHLKLITEEGC